MTNKKVISKKNWALITVVGLMGQLCWAVENTTFATYALDATGKSEVVTWMVALSATFTTIATFLGGTWSDRIGKRKKDYNNRFNLLGCCNNNLWIC